MINYDMLSRKLNMTDPDMGYWSYTYDANGNLHTQTDARLHTITFTYDNINRVLLKDYSDGTMTDVSYIYDETGHDYSLGRLTTVTDAAGTTQFWYDVRGRTTKTQRTIDSVMYETRSSYDALDRTKTITYPNGEVVGYDYDDEAGNLLQVAGYATYGSYNALGQPGTITYANGVITTYAYEPETYRLQNLSTQTFDTPSVRQNLTYDYDAVGNVESITDAYAPTRTQSFGYDHLHRLTSATSSYGTISYTYNQIGNMLTNSRVTGTYAYPAPGSPRPHAITQIGSGPLWTYDENGNVMYDGVRTIAWDRDNKPKTIGSVGFVYDYTGKRVKKLINSVTNTRYIGDIYECKPADGYCNMYIFGAGKRIAKKTTQASPVVRYYHGDHLGSTSLETDASGHETERYGNYPFGENWYGTGSEKYKFTDQEEDAETGLYNYDARHYDPVIGRFMSPDSIVPDFSDPQTLNRYSYCVNNPLIYTDPSGHIFGIDDVIIIAVVAAMAKGAVVGAAVGAATAAVNGTNIGQGALMGGISGAITGGMFYGAGEVIQGMGNSAFNAAMGTAADIAYTQPFTVGIGTQAAIHAGAGALSGGINAAITGGDIGMGMLTGGISGGIGKYAGDFLPSGSGSQLVGRSLIGGVTGGISAELYGGDFGQGFGQGAMTAGFGLIFNEWQVHGNRMIWAENGQRGLPMDGSSQAFDEAARTTTAAAGGASAAVGGATAAGPLLAKAGYALSVAYLSNAPAVNRGVTDFLSGYAAALGRIPASTAAAYGFMADKAAKLLGFKGP